jgi:hypothetical protein
MYAGSSLFVIAIGAVLYWAVSYRVPGINVQTVGLILMIIGAVGLLFSIISTATTRHHRLE